MFQRLIRRYVNPVVVRVYVDKRFDILPGDKPNKPAIDAYLAKMIDKTLAAGADIGPGDYTFAISGHENGETIFDLVPR